MSQNLLSNVFKPTYVYDTVGQTYSSRLELVNIDTVSTNNVSTLAVSVGDAYGNAYVGTNSGNAYSNRLGNSNVTALGVNAGQGSSNSSNAIFVGYGAGVGSLNAINTIAIGANTVASGSNNIYIGTSTGSASGTSNIFIGHNVTPAGTPSNLLLIGQGANTAISADMSSSPPFVGIGTTNPLHTLDVNGFAQIGGIDSMGALGINASPDEYTLNVNGNMQVSDGCGIFRFSNDVAHNSLTTIDVTGSYGGAQATLAVTGGFFSARGTLAATPTSTQIGTLKTGLFMVAVQTPGGTFHHAIYGHALSPTTLVQFINVCNASMISFSSGSINISNSSSNMNWVITYFPTP